MYFSSKMYLNLNEKTLTYGKYKNYFNNALYITIFVINFHKATLSQVLARKRDLIIIQYHTFNIFLK